MKVNVERLHCYLAVPAFGVYTMLLHIVLLGELYRMLCSEPEGKDKLNLPLYWSKTQRGFNPDCAL